jgi:hypothetical protein
VWSHPDLLPTEDDFDDPEGFSQGRSGLSELDEAALEDLEGTGLTDGPQQPPGQPDGPEPDAGGPRS